MVEFGASGIFLLVCFPFGMQVYETRLHFTEVDEAAVGGVASEKVMNNLVRISLKNETFEVYEASCTWALKFENKHLESVIGCVTCKP